MAGLIISEQAAMKLRYAAEALPDEEIGGFGRVSQNKGWITLEDIVIPPQTVGGAHTDIDQEDVEAFMVDAIRNGCGGAECTRSHTGERGNCSVALCHDHTRRRMPHDARCNAGAVNDWRLWWHKHPGTGKPTPSSTDKDTLYKLAGGFRFGWYIGLIISADASNEYGWIENHVGPWPMRQDDIDIRYAVPDDAAMRAEIESIVARNVSIIKPVSSLPKGMWWKSLQTRADTVDGTYLPNPLVDEYSSWWR